MSIENDINKLVKESIVRSVKSVKKTAKDKALKHRKKLTQDWFFADGKSFNFDDVLEITHVEEPVIKIGSGLSASISVTTYIDEGAYPEKKTFKKWTDKHGGGSSSEWILQNLQLKQGIIGLPEYASVYESENGEPYNGRGWTNGHNDHFHISDTGVGLDEWIQMDSSWKSYMDEIEEIVLDRIK